MSDLGAILTAIVTPFDAQQRVDEAAFVSLMHHLAANGSDGLVVCGTTGEAPTLTDEEHLGVIALAMAERPAGLSITAGVGSNDTRHACYLTEQACALGVDALLSVNPYYNRPGRRGILAHYGEISQAADRSVLLYNVPHRTGEDMPNDLLAELAQLDHIDGVKQANGDNLALIDGLDLFYTGNDDDLARTLDMGGVGGILVASHVVGPEMRAMVDHPEQRAAIDARLQAIYEALGIGPLVTTTKAALALLGHPVGNPRLPLVAADEREITVIHQALERHGLLTGSEATR